MKSLKSPIEAVEIRDGDTLEECDYEQRDISTEIVEEREYVIAGAVRENDGEDATESTQCGCRETFKRISHQNNQENPKID